MRFKNNPFFWGIAGFLAVWRITNIVQKEEIAAPVRKAVGIVETNEEDPDYWIYPDNFIGKVFHCFWCGSVWVAGLVTLILILCPPLVLLFALSAAAIAFKTWMESLEHPDTYIENYYEAEGEGDSGEFGDLGEDDAGQ